MIRVVDYRGALSWAGCAALGANRALGLAWEYLDRGPATPAGCAAFRRSLRSLAAGPVTYVTESHRRRAVRTVAASEVVR